ncbi:MAG TPA: capsule assembly Wzi family protein [Candidatus Dormibacteraeota bacterium]|nr:capsule assembly Wzi family protein [Candidatus Dormibacteraeota bacterium]
MRIRTALIAFVLAAGFGLSWAQSPEEINNKPVDPSPANIADTPQSAPQMNVPMKQYVPSHDSSRPAFARHIADFVADQKQIWTSPSRIRLSDATWLVPLGGVTAGLFVTDRQYSASLNQNPTTLRHYKTFSEVGVASLIGAGASLYLFSYPMHNERWRETGFLAGEAALNSLVTVEAFKYSFQRDRPYQGNGSGPFFQGGNSFPSEHSAAAWSVAGVIAHEYPGTLPKLFAYGMASAVSFSRVHARQHFPSDVLVGSVLGYLISQNVYRRHHDVEIGGAAWESPSEFVSEPKDSMPSFTGSPYVPLDSWIYPALERLAALGYVRTSILGLRPWTRLECLRLLGEAGERLPEADAPPEVQELYQSLSREFESERDAPESGNAVHAQVESVYVRTLGISGKPLTDNEHFGQTILNDYGRPFQEGFNSVVGSSAWTTMGPFVIYARGEYQSAPSAPSLSPTALGIISSVDGLPPNPPSMPFAATSRFQLLDAYVAMNLSNWQFSFGRQSLWWGPGDEGAMLFTNNAAPLNKMFRIDRVSPFQLPSVFRYFGDIRAEFFLGQLSGQQFINNSLPGTTANPQGQYGKNLASQPFLSGGKLSFKFTPNFEMSISKTTLYGGPGNPLTPKTLLQSSLALHVNGFSLGDGRAALDFNYRIPKLRDWLTVYGDAFQEDELSPANRPYKAAFQTGLYLAKVPRIPKLDLRIEGGTTSPINFPSCNGCYYSNGQYVNGYTNGGQLIGTWLGRASQGESVKSTYWLGPQKKIGVELRHRQVDRQFLSQGGSQNDAALNGDFFLRSGFRFSGTVQYERWQIPVLAANRQSNVMALFEVGFWPRVRTK